MKNIVIAILMSITLMSCSQDPPIFVPNNLDGHKVHAFGHGGMGNQNVLYPMNSKESVMECFSVGADGTDIDIQMSSDKRLFAYHDEFLESSTSNKSGLLSEHSSEQMMFPNALYKNTFRPMIVRRVEDILSSVGADKVISFDIKLYPPSTSVMTNTQYINAFAAEVVFVIEHYHTNSIIESESVDFINAIKALRPFFKVFYYPKNANPGAIVLAKNLGVYGLTLSNDEVSTEFVALAHKEGLRVILFSVTNHSQNLNAYQKSPEYIQSDALKDLIDVIY